MSKLRVASQKLRIGGDYMNNILEHLRFTRAIQCYDRVPAISDADLDDMIEWTEKMQCEGALAAELSQRGLSRDEVYTFSIKICDNDIDRDYECFSTQTLYDLAEMYVGKAGFIDRQFVFDGKAMIIYKTEVVRDYWRSTVTGDDYCWLKGYAYIPKTEQTKRIVTEIENSNKRDVSIGCAIKERKCSICGKDRCNHIKGKIYGGQECYFTLHKPTDVYEWSFITEPKKEG